MPFVVVNGCRCRPARRLVEPVEVEVEQWQQWALQCYQYPPPPHAEGTDKRAVILSAYLSVLLDGTERDRQTQVCVCVVCG